MKKQKSKKAIDVPTVFSDRSDERVGTVCISTAGHDKGDRLVIIAGIDRDHVYVADGKARKLIAPKKKKMRHLSMITRFSEQDVKALREGVWNDSTLRRKISQIELEKLT